MRPVPSLAGRCRKSAFSEQLVDQRAGSWNLAGQPAQLVRSVLRSLQYETPAVNVQVQLLTGSESECGADLGRNHQPTLLAQNERGIHVMTVA